MSKKQNRSRAAKAPTDLAPREMTIPGNELPEKRKRVSEGLTPMQQTFATTDLDLIVVLGLQAAATLGDPSANERLINKGTRAAVHSLGARDGVEALLAVQMVGAHNLAMKFLASAAADGQTDAGVELSVGCANRLLRTFTGQVETLKTYRSKGEQKVAVEHVHIHRGGQAIVGALHHSTTRGGGDDKKS
jgi:hypothetical protein